MVAKPKCILQMLMLRETSRRGGCHNIYYSNTIDSVRETTAVSAFSQKKIIKGTINKIHKFN